ncbi:MAG: hypothetical protein E7262_07965 [Lachnospiraceae bacterium]|nr:hypothetical protein [Lachnospiraceae bacterium]
MKKNKMKFILCIMTMCFCITYTNVCYAAGKYTVYSDKTKTYKGVKTALKSIGKVVSNKAKTVGKYPTRKGVILVTSTGKIANVVGHSAIIYSKGYIIESVEKGVVVSRNNWKSTKKNMAAVTVRKTTINQDSKVSDWCKKQKGKKYNYNYYSINSKGSYYCSQLIWAGYKNLYNINLNTKYYDVGSKKAIGPYEFVSKTSSVVYPIYMKNWNR